MYVTIFMVGVCMLDIEYDNIKEALNYFELTEEYTIEDLRKKLHEIVKKNHPDINNHENAEEIMKQANAYYDILLKFKQSELKKQKLIEVNKNKEEFIKEIEKINRCFQLNALTELGNKYISLIENIDNKESLERLKIKFHQELIDFSNIKVNGTTNFDILKDQFEKILLDDKQKYSNRKVLTILSDTFITKLLVTYDLLDLMNLYDEYEEKVNMHLDLIKKEKQQQEENEKANIKKTLKDVLIMKFHQFAIKSSNLDTIKATKLLERFLLKIEINDLNLLRKLMHQITDFDFSNPNMSFNESNIFINKYNASCVMIIEVTDTTYKYVIKGKNDINELERDEFNKKYISLENFIENSSYIGNKEVLLKSNKGHVKPDLGLGRHLYYYQGIILKVEEVFDDDLSSFSFIYNDTLKDWYYIFDNKINDRDVAKYQNKEILYEEFIEDFKKVTDKNDKKM